MMFFLLRCVLWLSIVYAAILLPQLQWRKLPSATASAGTEAIGHVKQRAIDTALDYCGGKAAGCVDEASKLTALIDAAGTVVAPAARAAPAAHLTPGVRKTSTSSARHARDPIAAMLTQRP